MRAFGPAELLDLWEDGLSQPPWQWARQCVRLADPALDDATTDALTVGERDTRLLELREALFGPELACRSACPACHATVEMSLNTSDLRIPQVGRGVPAEPSPSRFDLNTDARLTEDGSPYPLVVPDRPETAHSPNHPPGPAGSTWSGESARRLDGAGYHISLRAPNLRDLAATADGGDAATMRAALLARCVSITRTSGERLAVSELPAATLDDVLQQLSTVDPAADLHLELACPECERRWRESFDIVAYLRAELDAWAQRVLDDVHQLASAYGWTESAVLALSPRRRAEYLERVNA